MLPLPEVPDTALVLSVQGERRSQRFTQNKTPVVDTSSLVVKAEDVQKVNGLKKSFQRKFDKKQIENMKKENFVGEFSCYDVLPFCKTGLFLKDHALYIMGQSIIEMLSTESRVHFVHPTVVMSMVNLKTMETRRSGLIKS